MAQIKMLPGLCKKKRKEETDFSSVGVTPQFRGVSLSEACVIAIGGDGTLLLVMYKRLIRGKISSNRVIYLEGT